MSKEINILGVKERDLKNRVGHLESELADVKDQARGARHSNPEMMTA
jgi:hypothetical protein